LFTAALDQAEALEGLSWAAWWQDDAETVFSARERAFSLYRERGDPAGAARMAIWIGSDQNDFHGAAPVAAGWFERARRLLEPLPPCAEHGWLAFHEGYLAGSGEHGARAAALGRHLDVCDLEMLGLALEGSALVADLRVEDGMARLGEAAALALEGRAEIPISAAWTWCLLVSACVAIHDFERAYAWTDRIAAFAERYGSRWMLAFCRAEYGAVYIARGRWPDAEALLEAAIGDFEHSRPAWTSGALVALAELRRRQGRAAEALALLDRAGPTRPAQLCRASLTGDAALAERLLRRTTRPLDRIPLLVFLTQPERGQTPFREELRTVAELVPALEPLADQADGVATGDVALLEDAVDGLEGMPYEQALARQHLADALQRAGRNGASALERRKAAETLRGLGAASPLPGLTRREREVLGLLGEGLTNRQLAERLVVSEHTIHRHVTSILGKLDVPTRAAAAALAARHGLG
jgi:LuxR family transcriptional regulator, maltose regulon positive regulatory protein